jgi:uncharacterized protein YbjT (DUF2867 family)
MKVAVTGAGGRTGSLTVKRLLKEPNKYSVVAIVRRPEVHAADMEPSATFRTCVAWSAQCWSM